MRRGVAVASGKAGAAGSRPEAGNAVVRESA
jgi:hypothetical protein